VTGTCDADRMEATSTPPVDGTQEEGVPWALQLIVEVRRDTPPEIADLTTAAAVAVVRLLADPRSGPDGPWEVAVRRWESGPIRKLVRRGRGAAWDRACALEGLTVAHASASVHVVPPGPVRPLPPELDRLQVSGLVAGGARPATWRSRPGWPGVRVALTPEGDLTAGKLAAQAGHAAHLAWRGMDAERRDRWGRAGFAMEMAFPGPEAWDRLLESAPVVVRDAGFTETVPGQSTAVALP
jgi:hypothetical protein